MKKLVFLIFMFTVLLSSCESKDTYQISFETNGGTEVASIEVNEDEQLELPDDPSKEGFVFDGWFTDEEQNDVFEENQVILNSFTLYAKWLDESAVKQITFMDQETIFAVLSIEDFSDISELDTFKEGYSFKGWYYDQTFAHTFNNEINIYNSMTVYGKWNKVIDVTLVYNDLESEIVEDFSDNISTLQTPSLSGYMFSGWYYDSEYTSFAIGTDILEEDTTLYAKWVPVQNYVYLVYDQYALGRFLLGVDEVFDLEEVSISGFTFMGWYSDPEFTTPITNITGIDETMYVYGKYEQEVMNLPVEMDIDLSTLPYYDLLSETNPVVHIQIKDIGMLSIQLFPSLVGNTVDNFIAYIEEGAFSNSSFHRIIEDFMIQGGIVENTVCPIEGEFSENGIENDLSHTRGVLSMARTNDMNSATSQFFIVHQNSDFLDGQYAAFGGLVNGFNVLDYIASLTTSSTDAPIRDVIIEQVTIDYNGYEPNDRVCYAD